MGRKSALTDVVIKAYTGKNRGRVRFQDTETKRYGLEQLLQDTIQVALQAEQDSKTPVKLPRTKIAWFFETDQTALVVAAQCASLSAVKLLLSLKIVNISHDE